MAAWFISGASSGIGAELARQLVARGDSVALAARRRDRLEVLADDLRSCAPGDVRGSDGASGGTPATTTLVTTHELDVTDHDAVDRVVRAADAAHGGLDVVVANAGIGSGGRLGTDDHDATAAVLATNLGGVVSQVEVALALMQPRDHGQVVLVSSVAASRGLPGSAASYSASKAAVSSLGESLRIQMRGTGIAVTTLCPGYVRSEMTTGVPDLVKADTDVAVASMLRAIDRRRGVAYVPAWWRPLAGVLRVLPDRLVQRVLE